MVRCRRGICREEPADFRPSSIRLAGGGRHRTHLQPDVPRRPSVPGGRVRLRPVGGPRMRSPRPRPRPRGPRAARPLRLLLRQSGGLRRIDPPLSRSPAKGHPRGTLGARAERHVPEDGGEDPRSVRGGLGRARSLRSGASKSQHGHATRDNDGVRVRGLPLCHILPTRTVDDGEL